MIFNSTLSNNDSEHNNKYINKGFIVKLIILSIVFFIVLSNYNLYINERRHWINSDHAHLEAKEYYVKGKMVFFYRKMLNQASMSNGPVMQYLNKLQRSLFDKGVALLPPDDGERAVWNYNFFIYLYGKKSFLLPEDGTPKELTAVSPNKVKMLDDIYSTLEILATKPIADKEMDQMRHKTIPFVAMTYQINQGNYFGNAPGTARMDKLRADGDKYSRIKLISKWLDKNLLKLQAITDSSYETTISIVYNLMSKLSLSGDQIEYNIENNKFTCTDDINEEYISARSKLINKLNKSSNINKDQISIIYKTALQSGNDPVYVYLLNKHCNFPKDEAFPEDNHVNKLQLNPWVIKFEKQMLDSNSNNK